MTAMESIILQAKLKEAYAETSKNWIGNYHEG